MYQSQESSLRENAISVYVIGAYKLFNAYPNPFNSSTTVIYDLPQSQLVQLKVYDVLGRQVALLVDRFQIAGRYTETWNASGLASGLYFYHITAGQFSDTKKVLLIR